MDSAELKEMAFRALRAGALKGTTLHGTDQKDMLFDRYWIVALQEIRTDNGQKENVFCSAAGSHRADESEEDARKAFYRVIRSIGRNSKRCPKTADPCGEIMAHEVHTLIVLQHGVRPDGEEVVVLWRHPLLHPIRTIALLHDTADRAFSA